VIGRGHRMEIRPTTGTVCRRHERPSVDSSTVERPDPKLSQPNGTATATMRRRRVSGEAGRFGEQGRSRRRRPLHPLARATEGIASTDSTHDQRLCRLANDEAARAESGGGSPHALESAAGLRRRRRSAREARGRRPRPVPRENSGPVSDSALPEDSSARGASFCSDLACGAREDFSCRRRGGVSARAV